MDEATKTSIKAVEPLLQKIMQDREALKCKEFNRDEYLVVLTEDGMEATWCDRNADPKTFKVVGMLKHFDPYGTIGEIYNDEEVSYAVY